MYDLKNAPDVLGRAKFNCVVTNPPYVKSCGINNPSMTKAISRFEIACSLEDVLRTSKELLKPSGAFYDT